MPKVYAGDCEVGETFKWNNTTYKVLKNEADEDRLTVLNEDLPERARFEENFNPYAYVERVTG